VGKVHKQGYNPKDCKVGIGYVVATDKRLEAEAGGSKCDTGRNVVPVDSEDQGKLGHPNQ
jgi:hypothetical protein